MVFGAENSGGDQKLLCPSSPSLVLSLRAHWRRWDDALFCRKLDTGSYSFNLRFTQQPELGKRRQAEFSEHDVLRTCTVSALNP